LLIRNKYSFNLLLSFNRFWVWDIKFSNEEISWVGCFRTNQSILLKEIYRFSSFTLIHNMAISH